LEENYLTTRKFSDWLKFCPNPQLSIHCPLQATQNLAMPPNIFSMWNLWGSKTRVYHGSTKNIKDSPLMNDEYQRV